MSIGQDLILLRATAVKSAVIAFAMASAAHAAVTFDYAGKPFTQSDTPPGLIRESIIASIVFADSVLGYSGIVTGSSVLSWSIAVSNHPGTELTDTTGVNYHRWPLWFNFQNGTIAEWQVLASPNQSQQYPEIYTTHNTPYSSIYPTADYYLYNSQGISDGYNINDPGTWSQRQPVPEPGTLVMMLFCLIGFGAVRLGNRRVESDAV